MIFCGCIGNDSTPTDSRASPAREVQRNACLMGDAGLQGRFGEPGVDCFGGSLSGRPPQHRISCTPRSFMLLTTRSKNLIPSVCSIQRPGTSRVSCAMHAPCRIGRPVADHAFVADLYAQAVETPLGIDSPVCQTARTRGYFFFSATGCSLIDPSNIGCMIRFRPLPASRVVSPCFCVA
jgi:hypothetical protein